MQAGAYYACPTCQQPTRGDNYAHHVTQCQIFAQFWEKKRQIDSDARLAAFLQQQADQIVTGAPPPVSHHRPAPAPPAQFYPHQQAGYLQRGYGTAPPPGYSTAPPSSYSTAPPSSYSTAPPSSYSTAPPSSYSTAPPSSYSTAPPPSYSPPSYSPPSYSPPPSSSTSPSYSQSPAAVPPPRSVAVSTAPPPPRPVVSSTAAPRPVVSSPTKPSPSKATAAPTKASPATKSGSATNALYASILETLRLPSVPVKSSGTPLSNLPSVPKTQPHAAAVNPARKLDHHQQQSVTAPPRKHAPDSDSDVDKPVELPSQQQVEVPLSDGLTGREMVYLDNLLVTQLSQHHSNDDETALIESHLNMMLALRDHPLGAMLNAARQRFVGYFADHEAYSEEAAARTASDIWTAIDELVFATTCHYKEFNAKAERQACAYATISNALWRSITPSIVEAYCAIYRDDDAQHDAKIAQLAAVSPAELGIRELFWLLPHADADTDAAAAADTEPYVAAVHCLQRLPASLSPGAKCQCLVDTAQAICQAIQQHWKGRKDVESLIVGGDDLLPLLTLTIVRARVPHLYVHAKFMEHFIEQVSAIQQHGYILATLQTALAFIACIQPDQLSAGSLSAMLSPAAAQHQHTDDDDSDQAPNDQEHNDEAAPKRQRNRSIYLLHQDTDQPPPYVEAVTTTDSPSAPIDPFELPQSDSLIQSQPQISIQSQPQISIQSQPQISIQSQQQLQPQPQLQPQLQPTVQPPSLSSSPKKTWKVDDVWSQLDQLSNGHRPSDDVSSFDSLWDAAKTGQM